MNLPPEIWGPSYWTTLHFISSSYDNNPNLSIKLTMKNFIQSLPTLLPCKECQDHAFKYLKSSNLDKAVSNRKELFTFFFNFHNSVNQRLGKPLMKIKDALVKYQIPKEEYNLYSIPIPIHGNFQEENFFNFILGMVILIALIINLKF